MGGYERLPPPSRAGSMDLAAGAARRWPGELQVIIRDSAAGIRAAPAAPDPGARWSGRWVWPGTFAGLAVFLLGRSRFLFSTRLYPSADPAANSILVAQAEHFTLLHGNYSREEFFHPGPAYLYLMAAGQWLFHDTTHLVPTPWNGQLIAILLLNSALVATVAWIAGGWAASAWAAAAVAAVVVLGAAAALSLGVPAALNPEILASNWMPDVYVPTFLAFLVTAASVAAGRTAHLWLLAATGGLLIHGHVEFLFFVPLIVAAVAAGALWPARRAPGAAVRRFFRRRRPHWVPAAVVSAVFALPIAAGLARHWPGQFGQYLRYARSPQAGHHPVGEAARYLLWYWWPGPAWLGLLVLVSLTAAAAVVTVAVPVPAAAGGLRRFLSAALGIIAVTTAAMLFYAVRGIDDLTARYIGFFYWSVPLLAVLVVVTGLTAAGPGRGSTRAAVAGVLLLALGAAASAPGLRADVHDSEPALAPALAALAARSPGRLLVLKVAPGTSFDADGLVVAAQLRGVHICLTGPYFWVFAVTSQFICGPRQEANGAAYQLHRRPYRPAPGEPVIARLRYSVLTGVEGARSGG
jgi:hypothetical protein